MVLDIRKSCSFLVLVVVVLAAVDEVLRDRRRAGHCGSGRDALGGAPPRGLRLLLDLVLDLVDLVLGDDLRADLLELRQSLRAASPTRSSRLTASAKRRYVSTLAMTIRASIVTSSMPITEMRTNASITIPLSRITFSTSASPDGLGARRR